MSPSLWPLGAFGLLILAGLVVFQVAVPVVPWVQALLAVLGVALLIVGWRTLRGLVLVVSADQVWSDGRWHSIDEVSFVTLDVMLGTVPPLPMPVLVMADGATVSAGLYRYSRSSAVRAGRRLAKQLDVPYVSR